MIVADPKAWIVEHQEAVFEYYLGKITSKLIKSPFREDHKPTCGYYYGRTGRLYLHDFGTDEHFDCIEIVKRKFNIGYIKALDKILEDSKYFNIESTAELHSDTKLEYILGPTNLEYFTKLGISDKTLKRYGVHSVRAIYIDEDLYWRSTEKNPIFIYQFPSGTFKAYRPLSKDSAKKWKSNCTVKDIQGYFQLPAESKLLIITSSMKDVMVLRELGYNAIAFNSEGIPTKGENGKFVAETIEHLKSRFEHVILFLDNDAPGKEYTKKISTKYNLKSILIPDNEPKDISDYIAKYGRRKTKRMLNKQLKKLLTKETTTNELNVPY